MNPHRVETPYWESEAFMVEALAIGSGGLVVGMIAFFALAHFNLRWTWVIAALPPICVLGVIGQPQLFYGALTAAVTLTLFGAAIALLCLYAEEMSVEREHERETKGPLGLLRAVIEPDEQDPFLLTPKPPRRKRIRGLFTRERRAER